MVRGIRFIYAVGAGVAGLLVLAQPALAFSFNFSDDANNNGERGQTSFLFEDVDGSGIDMTVTARDLSDGAGATELFLPQPYLDGDLNGLPGGLGVCQGADPACSGSPDDNLGLGSGLGEVVILAFSSPVTLGELTFRNGIHELIFTGSTGIHVGAGNPTAAESFSHIFSAAAMIDPNLFGTRFSFVAQESFIGASAGDSSRLYIGALTFVPEPGTGLLVGMGLAVLASVRGKRSRRCSSRAR